MRALFKGAKLEVESVVREVCDSVLFDQTVRAVFVPANPPADSVLQVSKSTQRLRATALGIVGSVYCAVEANAEDKDAEYVRIDTKQQEQEKR